MYCHITGIVFWLIFPFNSSRALHKIIQKCSCSLFLLYAVFHRSHKWSRESNTIWVKTSLHLNTFNHFQIRFKTRFMPKNNTETIGHLFSRRRHSHNRRVQNVSFILWYWVDCLSLDTNKCLLWKINKRFWQCNSVFTTTPPRYLY